MFEIKDFSVSVAGKRVIDSISLAIKDGETHVIMGPNGAGKSTLAKALLGHPGFSASGRVLIDGEDISKLPTDERARRGLFLAFQNPEEVEGVKISRFIRRAKSAYSDEKQGLDGIMRDMEGLEKGAASLGMPKEMIMRELNVGFSGGEKKRLEMLQAISLKPKVLMLDEVDSGLDVDGVRLVAKAIEKMKDGKMCFLLITHSPRMLAHMKADYVHVMVDGRMVKAGDMQLAHDIEKKGYSEWMK